MIPQNDKNVNETDGENWYIHSKKPTAARTKNKPRCALLNSAARSLFLYSFSAHVQLKNVMLAVDSAVPLHRVRHIRVKSRSVCVGQAAMIGERIV